MKMTVRMRRWTLMALLCLLVAATPVLMQAGRAGAWSGDPTANTAICNASGIQQDPQITSDGSGGAIITWQDERSGNWDIYAQRVDSGGNVQWTTNGVAISATTNSQMEPEIISDGSGGAIITWIDRRSGNHYDVYAQRVDSSGNVQWTVDGAAICTNPSGNHLPCEITSDGSGGAIITWEDDRAGYMQYDVYAQKVNSSGIVQWTADGVPVCTATGDQMAPLITSDGSGGAIITWTDDRYDGSGNNIRAQRVVSGGPICGSIL